METGLIHLHNFLRWAILILLLASIIRAYSGWKQNRVFDANDKRTWLFTLIAAHIQFVLGLYQVLWGRYGILKIDLPAGESFMKSPFYRFYWMEHPLMMLISIILITAAYRMSKKGFAAPKVFRTAFWLFLIALIFILVSIPWPFREVIGRPWLPGI